MVALKTRLSHWVRFQLDDIMTGIFPFRFSNNFSLKVLSVVHHTKVIKKQFPFRRYDLFSYTLLLRAVITEMLSSKCHQKMLLLREYRYLGTHKKTRRFGIAHE